MRRLKAARHLKSVRLRRTDLIVEQSVRVCWLALAASGVAVGSKVLVPGFTFTAVPSAIVLLGAEPVFVECNADYRIDPEDLRRKITPETRVLLLSHMRGYISDRGLWYDWM